MKRWIGKGLLFCCLPVLMSCASTMNMIVEVEKPAAVTLPVTVQKVIVVNNVTPQPLGYGLNVPSGKNPESDSAYVETLKNASWRVIMDAFKYMEKSKFFPDISFYKRALRKDNEWLVVVPVEEELRKDFFENENFDLLISVDRLLFNSTLESNKPEIGKMTSLLTLSAYFPDKDKPVVHLIADSLKAYLSVDDFYSGIPPIDSERINSEMIRQSSSNLGEKLGKYFVPSWETAERIYFIKGISDLRKMDRYIHGKKWVDAKLAWTGEFEMAKKAADKAKLATNIALAYEMNDEFSVAGEWAEKAKTFFQNASSKKYSKEIKYLDEYVKVLQERDQNNVKLNEQYGISGKRD